MSEDSGEECAQLNNGPIISIGREEVVLDNENSRSASKGKKSHGFHLVRSKWDPYPWIGSVENASSADISGLRSGDCLLEIDGRDVLGLEMKDIAYLIGKNDRVNLSIWRRPPKSQSQTTNNVDFAYLGEKDSREPSDSRNDHTGTLLEGPLPEVAQKLVRAVSGVVKALECPVCLESAAPPVSQCVHGHLLCFGCRLKTARCPVCRVRLGQGRCLLADKSHRVLTEALVDPDVVLPGNDDGRSCGSNGRSLHDSIFGPSSHPKKAHHQRNKSPVSSLRAKHLLSKILSPNSRVDRLRDDRNVSTESLPTSMPTSSSSSSSAASCTMDGNLLYGRRWLLRLYDRRKSASTGELNKNPVGDSVNGSFTELRDEQETNNSGSYLSVPQTPVWGGSTESMTSGRLCCPLRERTGCRETINSGNLLEHLSAQHSGPLIHFYKKKVVLPIPLPFQEDAVYIIHWKDELFVLQSENDKVWVSNSESNCGMSWEWILHGVSTDGAELHVRKEVASLREPFELQPHHVATLPENFSAPSIAITLIELDTDEGCIKV
ncbi:uncharacterized protein LOC100121420 isoform X1 [Nasonia vitripennis]|uniref:Uncharacterized protein n=1 Tax=Nasonia vitripennis TaxID=7425 RepID=A0A7M7ISX8_NASVI|nr:uncharacterized protein LOC100121420 isoform X1 [Nasonia vitripennis]